MKRKIAVTAFCSLVATAVLNGQGLTPALPTAKPQRTAPATAPSDPLGRETPRGAMYEFLEACHKGDYALAARYLDLSKIPTSQQARLGPERAQQLSTILDRDTHFEIEQLDNTPDGANGDTLASDVDRLDTLTVNGHPTALYLERKIVGNVPVWLVSVDTVTRLPTLQSFSQASPLEKWVPAPLVRAQYARTPLWVWLGLLLIAVLLSLLSRLLTRGVIAVAKPVVKRFLPSSPGWRLHSFTEPLRLLVSVAVFRACMEAIAPSALVRDYILKVLALLFIFGTASLCMRIVELISDQWMSRLDPRERAMSHSVLPLGVRFVKICIFCLAVLATLRQWGVDITTVLAGVGVGGLALALAAQRTIENLFGGISVISDRPVLVGDFCQFGGQVGTVEDIGLRSTRIRTNDRTLVTVPNSQFSTMTLENYSRRDRFWFHPTLQLRRDMTPDEIVAGITAIEGVLRGHPKIDPTAVPVRFTKVALDGYVLEVFAYAVVPDFDEFLRVQTDLLLQMVTALREAHVELAMPLQSTLAIKEGADGAFGKL